MSERSWTGDHEADPARFRRGRESSGVHEDAFLVDVRDHAATGRHFATGMKKGAVGLLEQGTCGRRWLQ